MSKKKKHKKITKGLLSTQLSIFCCGRPVDGSEADLDNDETGWTAGIFTCLACGTMYEVSAECPDKILAENPYEELPTLENLNEL